MAYPEDVTTFPGSGPTAAQTHRRILPFARCGPGGAGRAVQRGAGRAGLTGPSGQLAPLQRGEMVRDPSQKCLLENQVMGRVTPTLSWKPKHFQDCRPGVSPGALGRHVRLQD